MKLLAFDTSGDYCSVAWLDGKRCISRHVPSPARHTEVLLPLCEAVLAEAGHGVSTLEAIAFGNGPGAFTGVRVAASAAHGMALARRLPIIPICTLQALAQAGWRYTGHTTQLAVIDARRGEVYWGVYRRDPQQGAWHTLHAPRVSAPAAVGLAHDAAWGVVGGGVACLPESVRATLVSSRRAPPETTFPHAEDIATLAHQALAAGAQGELGGALPVYLRDAI